MICDIWYIVHQICLNYERETSSKYKINSYTRITDSQLWYYDVRNPWHSQCHANSLFLQFPILIITFLPNPSLSLSLKHFLLLANNIIFPLKSRNSTTLSCSRNQTLTRTWVMMSTSIHPSIYARRGSLPTTYFGNCLTLVLSLVWEGITGSYSDRGILIYLGMKKLTSICQSERWSSWGDAQN